MSQTRSAADRAYPGADDDSGKEMLRLVQNMFLSTGGSVPRQVVVFCGVGVENGSSAVCANAGKTFAARSFRSICLVDANLRSPHLSGILGVDPTIASRRESASVRDQCIAISDNLWLAGADFLTDDGGALAPMTRLKQRFAELREAFEFVLVDAPAADVSGDTAILGQLADGTVLVIDAENTRRISARKVKESLDTANVRLLGTVLHNRSFPLPRGLYDRL